MFRIHFIKEIEKKKFFSLSNKAVSIEILNPSFIIPDYCTKVLLTSFLFLVEEEKNYQILKTVLRLFQQYVDFN